MTEKQTEIPVVKEPINTPDVSIRQLSPENPKDREIAKNFDLASLEAINPFTHEIIDRDVAHEAMTEEQLTRWMTNRENGMMRVIEVLDTTTNTKKAIGFAYFYDDAHPPKDGEKSEKPDQDFTRRAQEIRKMNNLSDEYPLWEMNFWVNPGTSDEIVQRGVEQVLAEFAKGRKEDRALVMFADSEDIADTARDLIKEKGLTIETKKKELSDRAILESLAANKDQREKVANRFQDTKVLKKLGFGDGGEMIYAKKDILPSWMYFRTIFPNKPLTPPASPPPPTPAA